jgi:lipoic acid synthetase
MDPFAVMPSCATVIPARASCTEEVADTPRRLPRWLKRNIPKGHTHQLTAQILRELRLATVCEEARCPNRMECYSRKTATFMILGDICTRSCRFCAVRRGKPAPPDPDEPRRIAEAVEKLGLNHVVITCVTRDDLPDGGAEHFVRTIEAIRVRTAATIEILPSDLGGNMEALDMLIDAAPEVYNYNTETVPRLYLPVRGPKADYKWTLEIFRHIRKRNPAIRTKTGMMLGLGETVDEVLDWLGELVHAGCQILTLGQYLQPGVRQIPVVRYVPPEEFRWLGELARRIGFREVAAGPFVRSSYRAGELLQCSLIDPPCS